MNNHKERAHSRFSASGSERWLSCPASVELEEQAPPKKDSVWSKEGTLAHEVLEAKLNGLPLPTDFDVTPTMIAHVDATIDKIKAVARAFGGRIIAEKKVFASFIHPEMFGTCDVIIPANNRVLHIMDFKYGQGHVVSPEGNTQLLQYALSVADSYDWETHFDFVKMWILQPRAGGDWAKSWMIPISELKLKWLPLWHKGVARVVKGGNKPMSGRWCHFCAASKTCPAKTAVRIEKITALFDTELP